MGMHGVWHVLAGHRDEDFTAGRAWRARLNLLERAVGVEDDTVEDYVLQLHSA